MAVYRSRAMAGFTLLELLVTLVIATLALSIVAPRFEALLPGVVLKGETRTVAAYLRYARSRAIASGEVSYVSMTELPPGLMVSSSPRVYEAEPMVKLTLDGLERDENQVIAFYPNGGSSGGRIHLSHEGQRYRVEVNWLTGGVVIHE